MKTHYYTSISDPQIEKDVSFTERVYDNFAKRYRSSAFTTNANTLKQALTKLNAISEDRRIGKATRYLALLTALNTGDEKAQKKLNLYSQRLTQASNKLLFFSLELGKISKAQQKKFLNDKRLVNFQYELSQLFEHAKHQLTEAEEKIIRQLYDCSYGMWVEAIEKMLGKRTISYRGEIIPVNEAFGRLESLPLKEQTKYWNLIMTAIDPLKETVEHELTAIVSRKKITDELRGYKEPYSASILNHEDDEKSVLALIDAVSKEGFKLSRKFYKLKAKLLNQSSISYAERSAAVGTLPTISFKDGTEICREIFYGVNPVYGEIFDSLLTNGQIDVYPKAGKRGGAFCWGDTGQPTNVFLNQTDTVRSLETYAHEMGHAIHTERSKLQPAHYQGYSTTTAETASTFFEGLVSERLLELAPKKQKLALLHNKLSGDVATIQRQIAFFNFELEMHRHVRTQGAISHQELNTLMQKHLRSYCGPAVVVNELDGNSYIYVSHFRYGFYVYTYTFGMLMSSQMIDNLKSDPNYAKEIDHFLTAGGSDTVANIFSSIGLDTKNIATFTTGLNKMKQELKTLEKLMK
jgi:oligoendopeptidase F